MAVDMFLKIDGIDGDSTHEHHAKWIEVSSFSWGVSNPVTFGTGGGGGAGKASLSDLSFMMPFNKSSPELFLSSATGKHFKWAELALSKTVEERSEDFYKIKMYDVVLSSYQASGSSEIPFDSTSLNFSKIEFNGKAFDLRTNVGT